MNRYPLWKYLIIAAAFLIGLTYTLPNFFGESPAVQVSPLHRLSQPEAGLFGRVETELKAAGITYTNAVADASTVKVRFASTDVQIHAKDVLQSKLGENYVVALNLLSNSPGWLSKIHALPMYLGLDLRGGVHFLMQVDMKAALDKKIESLTSDVRGSLRAKKILYSGVAREGERVVVRFSEPAEKAKALTELGNSISGVQIREEDGGAETRLVLTVRPEEQKRIQEAALQQNIITLRNRVNELGVSEPIIQQQGGDRVVVQLPGVQDTARAKEILGRTATLEVRMVEAHASNSGSRDYEPAKIEAALQGNVPVGMALYRSNRDSRAEPLLLSKQIIMTGERFTDAAPGFDNNSRPSVNVSLDGQGARIMTTTTRDAIKRRMAIILIEKGKPEVLTAPTIQSELGARFQITGMASTQEAKDLSLLIRAGALAAPMEIVEERTVGPSLGAENISRGFHSTWIGFTGIAIFMSVYYLLFGAISVLALAFNLLLLIALLSMLQATLTLPGIAAIALTLGMAIDANVLINERVREELRSGNTPHTSIAAGYERAWATILDSNVTTLIAGLALFAFGTGPIKGFAVVHCLGILTSMFSAVLFSRGLVNLVYGGRKRIAKLSIGQVWRPDVGKTSAKA